MDGISFKYRLKNQSEVEITPNLSQYIFVEARQQVVVRYYLTKAGIDVEATKLLQETEEPDILDVRVLVTKNPFISQIKDFDKVEINSKRVFDIDFAGNDNLFFDVLYTSLTDEDLKVEVATVREGIDTFETEYTLTDRPDEFVKVVGVSIKYETVTATYVHRRSGRLRMAPMTIQMTELAPIMRDRLVVPSNPDKGTSTSTIRRALNADGWFLDSGTQTIYREEARRRISMTDAEMAEYIAKHCTTLDILGLLTTSNTSEYTHPLYTRSIALLQQCDKQCSLMPATQKTIADHRT